MNLNIIQSPFNSLNAKQRLEWILNQKNTYEIVKELPIQDLIWTIQEIGVSDCHELLELIHPKQVRAIVDLCGWRIDQIDCESIQKWLIPFMEANPKKALQQFLALDIELMALLFKTYAKIDNYHEDYLFPDNVTLYSMTPDRSLVILFHGEEADQPMMRFLHRILDELYERDVSYAIRLLESIRFELESSLEEEALRWKDARLQDLGFPSALEARSIFAYLSPHQLAKQEVFALPKEGLAGTLLTASTPFGRGSFEEAFSSLNDTKQQMIKMQLVSVANQVHMATASSMDDVESLKNTFRYVVKTCEIALDYLHQTLMQHPKQILAEYAVQTLFRVGHSLSLKLQRELLAMFHDPNFALKDQWKTKLGSPMYEVIEGLLSKQRPLFYMGLKIPEQPICRPFESLEELLQTGRVLQKIGFMGLFFSPKGLMVSQEGPVYTVYLATWLSHGLLGNAIRTEPLNIEMVKKLHEKLIKTNGKNFAFDHDSKMNLMAELKQIIAILAHGKTPQVTISMEQWMFAFASHVFERIELELCALDLEHVEPAWIGTLWVK